MRFFLADLFHVKGYRDKNNVDSLKDVSKDKTVYLKIESRQWPSIECSHASLQNCYP